MSKSLHQLLSGSKPEDPREQQYATRPRRGTMESTSSSLLQPHLITNRQDLLQAIHDLEDELQSNLRKVEVSYKGISRWKPNADVLLRGRDDQKPKPMAWYRDHIDDLAEEYMERLKVRYQGAQKRLAELIEEGEFKEKILWSERQAKKLLDQDMKRLGGMLLTLKMNLEEVEKEWQEKFQIWKEKESGLEEVSTK